MFIGKLVDAKKLFLYFKHTGAGGGKDHFTDY